MKRREQTSSKRAPIPECLQAFRCDDWLTEAERALPARDDNESAERSVDCYRRWQRAYREWAQDNGYTEDEMWVAHTHPSCRGIRVLSVR